LTPTALDAKLAAPLEHPFVLEEVTMATKDIAAAE